MNGKHVLTTAALLLACAAGRLTAQGGTSAPAKGAAGADPRAKMMARFDKDGDGKLDKAEMAEAQKAMAAKKTVQVRTVAEIRQEMLAKYDKNGDGRLDGNERALAGKMMFESRYATMTPRDKQMILHQFDRDGDGKLSEAEKAAIHAPPASPGAPKAPSARAMIGSYDKNGDKMLDASELTQLLRSRGVVAPVGTVTVPPEVRLEILREHDKNKNGVIDPSERDAANAALDAKRKQLEAAAKADPQAATRPAPEARERDRKSAG